MKDIVRGGCIKSGISAEPVLQYRLNHLAADSVKLFIPLECEREIYSAGDEHIGHKVVPLDRLVEEEICNDCEDH